MIRDDFDASGATCLSRTEAQPECGEDFCDRCGDCLACFGGDPCVDGQREHYWVRYAKPTDRRQERPAETP